MTNSLTIYAVYCMNTGKRLSAFTEMPGEAARLAQVICVDVETVDDIVIYRGNSKRVRVVEFVEVTNNKW